MELKDLCGKHILSGIEKGTCNIEVLGGQENVDYVKFCLDGISYVAIEDPEDDYRSTCRELEVSETECRIKLPDVEVVGIMKGNERYEDHDILMLIDCITGKVVLSVGTANYDDYYPYCVMEWTPENLSCNINEVAGE